MPKSVLAEFDGKVIIPNEPLGFSPGQRLRITIEAVTAAPQSGNLDTVLPPELERRDDGAIVVRGHRVSLHLILEMVFQGAGTREICERFPDIPAAKVDALLEFCRQHAEPIRRYYEQQQSVARQYCDVEHRAPSLTELRERRTATGRSSS
jgi:uncharacterized protein (DUF433 family)